MTPLDRATWVEVDDSAPPLLLVPVGSCEQHGPHLPLGTDTLIATALAMRVGRRVNGCLVTPAIAIGASGEHAGFAGTLSIGTEVLTSVLVELARSADWAAGMVFVNGHGGNVEAVRAAVRLAHGEGRRVSTWWPEAPDDERSDAHAGWTETSVMLHLDPSLVRSDARAAGDTRPIAELLPTLRLSGVAGVSSNGVLGDPTTADPTAGAAIVERWTASLERHIIEFMERQ